MDFTIPDYQDSIIIGRTGYYQWNSKNKQIVRSPFEDVSYKIAGGGFLSNAGDLAKMGTALRGTDFIQPETRTAVIISQKLSDGKETGYGMGFKSGRDSRGRQIIHHGGIAYGGRAFLIIYPDQDGVIAVTCNLGNAAFSERHLERLADLFLKN